MMSAVSFVDNSASHRSDSTNRCRIGRDGRSLRTSCICSPLSVAWARALQKVGIVSQRRRGRRASRYAMDTNHGRKSPRRCSRWRHARIEASCNTSSASPGAIPRERITRSAASDAAMSAAENAASSSFNRLPQPLMSIHSGDGWDSGLSPSRPFLKPEGNGWPAPPHSRSSRREPVPGIHTYSDVIPREREDGVAAWVAPQTGRRSPLFDTPFPRSPRPSADRIAAAVPI